MKKIENILRLYSSQRHKLSVFTALSLLLSLASVWEIKLFSSFIDSLGNGGAWKSYDIVADPVLRTFIIFILLLFAEALLTGLIKLTALNVKSALDRDLKNKLAFKLCEMPYAALESKDIQDSLNSVRESEYTPFAFWQDLFKLLHYGVQFCGMLFIMAQAALWPAVLLLFAVAAFVPLLLKAGQEDYQAYRQSSAKFRKAAYVSRILYDREYAKERRTFAHTHYFNGKWFEDFEAGRLLSQAATRKNFLKLKAASITGLFIFIACSLLLLWPLKNGALSLGVYIAILTAFFKILEFLKNNFYYLFEELSGEYAYLQELTGLLFSCGDNTAADVALSGNDGVLAAAKDGVLDTAAVSLSVSADSPSATSAGSTLGEGKTCTSFAAVNSSEKAAVNSWKKIEFKNVSFAYPNSNKEVLQNIDLTFEAGKVYALVGSNGAGKSTLINLLTALYTDYSGEILIDGVELRKLPRTLLQSKSALAPQKFEKFALSVQELLSLGRERSVTAAALATLPQGLQIDDLLDELQDGLATKLGKLEAEARDLSGGQWQRLVIARALLREADLFIFDEPTASLDPNAERAVYRELVAAMKQGIGLLITHRLGAIAELDDIILLADGKVAAVGNHHDLLKASPLYAEMYEAQKSWYE